MPYIKQEDRPEKDAVVYTMLEVGLYGCDLTVFLYKYCEKYVEAGYNNYKNYIADISECEVEMGRRTDRLIGSPRDERFSPKFLSIKDLDYLLDVAHNANVVANGDLNYILFKYCKLLSHSTDDVIGVRKALRLSVKDIREELLAPYEDKKIEENGDV